MKSQKLFLRWKRRYLKLLHKQWMILRQTRREGKPEQTHELRVTLRRLRLMVRLGAPLLDDWAVDEYLRWSRTVSAATSRLRDYDVTLEWLKGRNGAEAIVELLRVRRDRLWRIHRPRLMPPTSKVRLRLSRIKTGRKPAAKLRRRFLNRFDRLHRQVFEGISHFFELTLEERHAFRRILRRLRYLRELGLSRKKQVDDGLLKNLIPLQIAMGEYQNLVVAESMIKHLKRSETADRLGKAITRQQVSWEVKIRHGLKSLADTGPSSLKA